MKKYFIYTFLLLLCSLTAFSQDEYASKSILIFHKSGDVTTISRDEADSLTFSNEDAENVKHDGIVTQQVHLGDSVLQTLIDDVDSVVFTPPAQPYPMVTTRLPKSDKRTSATLRGQLYNAQTKDATLGFRLNMGKFPKEEWVECSPAINTYSGNFELDVHNLTPGRRYTYHAYAMIGSRTYISSPRSFYTEHVKIETLDADIVRHDKVTVNGIIDDMSELENAEFGFFYGTEGFPKRWKDYPMENCIVGGDGKMQAELEELEPGKTYLYQAFVTINDTTLYGGVKRVRTAPEIITYDAENVTEFEAELHCSVKFMEAFSVNVLIGFEIARNPAMTDCQDFSVGYLGNHVEMQFLQNIKNLMPDNVYYFRAYAKVEGVKYYGEVKSLRAKSVNVKTYDADEITSSSAFLSGSLMDMDVAPSGSGYGICYGTDVDPIANGLKAFGYFKEGTSGGFGGTISGLVPETTYNYCAYVIIDGNTYYGEVKQFTTLKEIIVTTYDVTDVKSTTAKMHLGVEGYDKECDEGYAGFIIGWGEDGSFTTDNSIVFKTGDLVDTPNGHFYDDFSGFSPGTTYYYQAYAVVNNHNYYGERKKFTTLSSRGELGLFELSGPVKSCTHRNAWNIVYTRTFDKNGFWLTYNGESLESIYYSGIERDDEGRIVKGYGDEGQEEEYTYDEQGRIVRYYYIYWDDGEEYEYTYGSDDAVMASKRHYQVVGLYAEEEQPFDETYSDVEYDSYGNWIKRTVHYSTGGTATETRTITYY